MPLQNLTIIDPRSITNEQCPVFVQCADTRSFFGWGIRKRTKSNWNHSTILFKKGRLANQAWFFKEIDIAEYMKPGGMMKFWVCGDITIAERNAIMFKIAYELKKPWHSRMYDWPGIVGQFFGLRWFNIPSLNYCSEINIKFIKVLFPEYNQRHPTPEEIDALFKGSERMGIMGYWMDV